MKNKYKIHLNIWPDGTKVFCLNGKPHNENGPARIWPDGSKEFYLNGKLHNKNGPAAIYSGGTKYFYLNDKWYSEQEYNLEISKKKS